MQDLYHTGPEQQDSAPPKRNQNITLTEMHLKYGKQTPLQKLIIILVPLIIIPTIVYTIKGAKVTPSVENEQKNISPKVKTPPNNPPSIPKPAETNQNDYELYSTDVYYFTYPTAMTAGGTDHSYTIRTEDGFSFATQIIENRNLKELTSSYEKQSDPLSKYATDDYIYYEASGNDLMYHLFTNIGGNNWVKRTYNTLGEIETSDLVTLLESFTPEVDTTSWNTYTSEPLKLSIKYPNTWKLTIGTHYVKNAVVLTKESEKPAERSRNVEIIIGDYEVYSTSGVVCANRNCEEVLTHYFIIEENPYESIAIKSSWPTEKDFEHLTGDINLGQSDLPPIYYSAHNFKQLREIRQIVNTIITDTCVTYTSSKYNYSVKFPETWKLVETHPNGNLASDASANEEILEGQLEKIRLLEKLSGKYWPGSFEISVSDKEKEKTLDEWAEDYNVTATSGARLDKFIGDTAVSGYPAKKFSIFAFDHSEKLIVTKYNGLFYFISYIDAGSNDPDSEYHEGVYRDTLESFRFIE